MTSSPEGSHHQTRTDPEKCLLLLLRLFALVLLLALVPVFFPFSWMAAIHDRLGIGSLPDIPIIGYLTRSASLLYGTMGIYYLVMSLDLPRYAPLLAVFCWVKIVFGAGLVVLDALVGMPLPWVLCEGPVVAGAGVVMLWLLRCRRREKQMDRAGQP